MATEWDDIRCQLAWAAGFFDGEGSTGTWPNKNRPGAINLFANVTQQSASSDEIPAVLTRFRVAVRGLGRISAPTPDLRSGTYLCQWRTHSFEEVQAVVALLWQDLGPVKRAQAARALRRRARSGPITLSSARSVRGIGVRPEQGVPIFPLPSTRSRRHERSWRGQPVSLTVKVRPRLSDDVVALRRGLVCVRRSRNAMRTAFLRS